MKEPSLPKHLNKNNPPPKKLIEKMIFLLDQGNSERYVAQAIGKKRSFVRMHNPRTRPMVKEAMRKWMSKNKDRYVESKKQTEKKKYEVKKK